MEVDAVALNNSWPKEFPELQELDDLLKCAICYEYLQTALISACSHSFCSICIRKYLQYKDQCPTCFSDLFDNQLRNDRVLDAVVQVFRKVKSKLCHHLRVSSAVIPSTSSTTNKETIVSSQSISTKQEDSKKIKIKGDKSHSEEASVSKSKKRANNTNSGKSIILPKRCLDIIEVVNESNNTQSSFPQMKVDVVSLSEESDVSMSKKLQTNTNLVNALRIPKHIQNLMTVVTENPCSTSSKRTNDSSTSAGLMSPSVSKIRVPDMFTTSPKSVGSTSAIVPQNSVPCPVCSVDIPESNINLHLDKCLLRASGQLSPADAKIENKMKRLPKLVYTLLSDKDLKKKAKEYGLNIFGDRKALISRLKRYTVIYNSECDKASPRSLIEILQQVEKEEKLEQRANAQVEKPTTIFNNITRNTDEKVINEVNEKYIKENENTFKTLIQKMKDREGSNIRPTGHVNRIFDDVDISDSEIQPDHSEAECTPTPKRSTSDRLPSRLFDESRVASPESPVLSNKCVPDSSLYPQLMDVPIDNSIDNVNNQLDQSNESFSILDDSQLDFPIDSEPDTVPEIQQAPVNASVNNSEDENSGSSVELFVPQSRQKKRKVMESVSTPNSANSFTKRLRKRVNR